MLTLLSVLVELSLQNKSPLVSHIPFPSFSRHTGPVRWKQTQCFYTICSSKTWTQIVTSLSFFHFLFLRAIIFSIATCWNLSVQLCFYFVMSLEVPWDHFYSPMGCFPKERTDGEGLHLSSSRGLGLLYLSCQCTGRGCETGGGGRLRAAIICWSRLIESAARLSWYRSSRSHLQRSKALIGRQCHRWRGPSVHPHPEMTGGGQPEPECGRWEREKAASKKSMPIKDGWMGRIQY